VKVVAMETHDERAALVPSDEPAAGATLFDADVSRDAAAPSVPRTSAAALREVIEAKHARVAAMSAEIDELAVRRAGVRGAVARALIDGASGESPTTAELVAIDDRIETLRRATLLLADEADGLEDAHRAAVVREAEVAEADAVADAGARLDALHDAVVTAVRALPTEADVTAWLAASRAARAHREAVAGVPRSQPFADNLPRDIHAARRAATLRIMAQLWQYADAPPAAESGAPFIMTAAAR
jgi:hypothetical protein